jgi:hypothetical protein
MKDSELPRPLAIFSELEADITAIKNGDLSLEEARQRQKVANAELKSIEDQLKGIKNKKTG